MAEWCEWFCRGEGYYSVVGGSIGSEFCGDVFVVDECVVVGVVVFVVVERIVGRRIGWVKDFECRIVFCKVEENGVDFEGEFVDLDGVIGCRDELVGFI